jgi:hypothetical protein
MFLAAVAAIAASSMPQPAPSAGVSAQATATIRVISGVRVSFDGDQKQPEFPRPRDTTIRTADAERQPARLIEFQ